MQGQQPYKQKNVNKLQYTCKDNNLINKKCRPTAVHMHGQLCKQNSVNKFELEVEIGVEKKL